MNKAGLSRPFCGGPFETDLVMVFPPFARSIVSMENLGVEYIAAVARARGFRADIVNAGLHGLGVEDVIDVLSRTDFAVMGISTIHWTIREAIAIAEAVREIRPACHIVFGGVEAALTARELLLEHPCIDSVGVGEGEEIVCELLRAVLTGQDWRQTQGLAFRRGDAVLVNPLRRLIDPLDSLPFPVRDDIAAVVDSGGPVCISSSRGCFAHCVFCSTRAFYRLSRGRAWRGRSASSVVAEIKQIHDTYKATHFAFVDETVEGPGPQGAERLREIARLIKQSGIRITFSMDIRADQIERDIVMELKEAGLCKVELGVESMAPTQLARYGKTATVEQNREALKVADDLGVAAEPFMIPYDPDVTHEEFRKNLAFYKERFSSNAARYDVTPLTMAGFLYPYPGTRVREVYADLGAIGSGTYSRCWIKDDVLRVVQQVVSAFVIFLEPAMPMSFQGLGNLWTNGSKLPSETYRDVCEIANAVGTLLADVTEWAYEGVRRPTDGGDHAEAIVRQVGVYATRAIALRQRLYAIVRDHGLKAGDPCEGLEFHDNFSRDLFAAGRKKRMSIIKELFEDPLDPAYIVSRIFSVIKSGGYPCR